jgi:TolB-like protein/DNA-binding SARP family transcriptional activator
MFLLRLFGGISLEGVNGPLSGRAVQRHRLAMLALVAGSPGGRVSREKLIAYLWPEVDAERGRHLLSNSLYLLRQVLGDAVSGTADAVRLDPERVRCDLREYEAAVAAGELERAVELYSGPFLDGFFLSNTPEFERWIEEQRDLLARSCGRALETLATERAAEGDFTRAADWWRKLAAHDPYSSRVALRLMEALVASGEPGAALKHARVHETVMGTELGIEPEPSVLALATRLREERGTGRTGSWGMREAPLLEAPGLGSVASAQPHGRRRWGRSALGLAAVAFLALGASAPLIYRWYGQTGRSAEPGAIRALAVLPLEDLSDDPEQQFFADGMTDALITELARYGQLRVTSRTSVMQYRNVPRSLPRIARELSVEAVVEGTVLHDGDRVRIIAQLVHAATNEHLWAESYERDLRDVLTLQSEIAEAIARSVRLTILPDDAVTPGATVTIDPQAYALYLRGRHLWNQDGLANHRAALDYFERVIEREPDFAPAYSGASDIYVHVDDIAGRADPMAGPRAKAMATRAIDLDPSLAEAHTSLAHVLMHERNWEEAEREYRRAIALNPSYAYARILYAFHLVAHERFDEAAEQARLAVSLDPLSQRTNSFAGYTQYFASRYPEAIRQWRHTAELHPDFPADVLVAQVYLAQGRRREAVAQTEAIGRPGEARAGLAWAQVYAGAGRPAEARRILDETLVLQGQIDPLEVAMVYSRLGDRDLAFRWLDLALQQGHGWLMFLRVEPAYDPIRADPRFGELLRRMRLE